MQKPPVFRLEHRGLLFFQALMRIFPCGRFSFFAHSNQTLIKFNQDLSKV
nr:MAG TPA: hypothetical protein [Caudoviricetes sp.]